jgi:putative membrane protein
MIVRPRESWFRLLFVWHGSVLPTIIPQLVFIAALSSVAVATHGRVFGEKIPLSTALLTLFGLTLALFLGFRNSASYERYKEARALWGRILIASRAVVSQILCYVPARDQAWPAADLLVACVYGLKHQLRDTDPDADLRRLLGPAPADALRAKTFKAIAVLHALREHLTGLNTSGRMSDVQFWTVDAQVKELSDAIGGCERIASTPIPLVYSVLLHRTVYTYCVLLPFGLVDSAELFTPLLCVFLSYTLIALEAIATEVADPFGMAPNALALDAIARNIERSIMELCERPLPEPIAPDHRYQLT